MKDDFRFNSYKQKSPIRVQVIAELGLDKPGFPEWVEIEKLKEIDQPRYEQVNCENYPKLFEALLAECIFRGITMPACYIDKGINSKLPLAHADIVLEAVFIEQIVYTCFTKDELRALVAHEVRHLYQDHNGSNADRIKNEIESDKASIESTNYQTCRSFINKSISLMIDRNLPTPLYKLTNIFHRAFPNLIAENCYLKIDKFHPSIAERMKLMKNHEYDLSK